MRALLLLVAITPAAADDHVTAVSADLLVAPRLKETRVVMGRLGFLNAEMETARLDLVDLYDDSLFDIRGSFLGGAFRIARPEWGVTVGLHIVTVWTDSYRYFTPYVVLRLGAKADVHAMLEARSQGVYVGAVGEPPGRVLTRDFDLEARLVTPGRAVHWEVRARYRDLDAGNTRVRDAMLCTGLRLAAARDGIAWLPVFVGLGIRQERWRDEEPMGDVAVEATARPRWQTLLWLAVDFGAEGRLWRK